MITKIADGWPITGVSDSQLPPNLAESGQVLNLLFGILPSQARPEQAVVGIASACFTFQKISEFTPTTSSSLDDPTSYQTTSRRRFICCQWNE